MREAPDGKVLLRCWAGCDTAAMLAALGLRWSDLFPDGKRRPRTARSATPHRRKRWCASSPADLTKRVARHMSGSPSFAARWVTSLQFTG